MEGKKKIIDDIISSAEKAAETLVSEAEREAQARLNALSEELSEIERSIAAKHEEYAQEVYAGQIKLGELDAGKVVLKAKQTAVDAVYDGVKQKILNAPDKEYLALLQNLIVSVCEDGDEVIASASDKRITAAWVEKLAKTAKKKLALCKTRGDFSGGVILRNGKFDRNLTVDEIVADLKERTIAATVKDLGL